MTNSVTTDPLTLTAVSHHAALCRCTSGRYSASPRSHMVQIRDFAGSKDAQSHTRKYFSHQQLHCLLFEVSQMHDFPQIGYVKRNVDEKETCESVVWFPPRILCATLYYYPPSFRLHSLAASVHATVLFCSLSYCLPVLISLTDICYVTQSVTECVQPALSNLHSLLNFFSRPLCPLSVSKVKVGRDMLEGNMSQPFLLPLQREKKKSS